ncbi:MAG TPA: hypothetical protein VK447_00840 [Myxococcaceae bacterium]|nr:hypothetical protein [Myxococcaceae bacterium]
MAASNTALQAVPSPIFDGDEVSYDAVRNTIRTGDLLLFRGTALFSKTIRLVTNSEYSHAGFAVWWDTRLLCFQAVEERGVEVVPLSSAVGTYDGRVDLFRLKEEAMARVNTEKLITNGIEMLGRKYAKSSLVRLAWRIITGKLRGHRDDKAAPAEAFCSQYVSYCYRMSGLDLVPDIDDGSTSPGDIAKSDFLNLQAVLRDDPITRARRQATQQALPGKPRTKPV